jgi:hypothetical protein
MQNNIRIEKNNSIRKIILIEKLLKHTQAIILKKDKILLQEIGGVGLLKVMLC